MALQRPSHSAEAEALEPWRGSSALFLFRLGPDDHITMTRLTFAAVAIQDFGSDFVQTPPKPSPSGRAQHLPVVFDSLFGKTAQNRCCCSF